MAPSMVKYINVVEVKHPSEDGPFIPLHREIHINHKAKSIALCFLLT
jgi:hypothetical protein